MEEKRWKCLVSGKAISISECHDCHTRSCPVNTGFAEGPDPIEDVKSSDEASNE